MFDRFLSWRKNLILDALDAQAGRVLHAISTLSEQLKEMRHTMATRDQLDAAEDTILIKVKQLGENLVKTLGDIQAKNDAGQDFTAELDKANQIAEALGAIDTSVKAADPGQASAPAGQAPAGGTTNPPDAGGTSSGSA